MAITLPTDFTVLGSLGREAYAPEQIIGEQGEQETVVHNDHWLRAQGVTRHALSTQTDEFTLSDLGSAATVFSTGRVQLASERTKLRLRVHWMSFDTFGIGLPIAPVGLTFTFYDGATAVVLDTYNTPTLATSGLQSLDTYVTVALASTDVRVEITGQTAVVATELVRLIGALVSEEPMVVADLYRPGL